MVEQDIDRIEILRLPIHHPERKQYVLKSFLLEYKRWKEFFADDAICFNMLNWDINTRANYGKRY